ncbi:MAG: glycosyltransferase family 4 protein [Tepidisphaeraceae bacterium]
MPQRRILLFLTDLEVGGTPTVVRELSWRLVESAGVHVEVASLKTGGVVMEQLREKRINVRQFDLVRTWEVPTVVSAFARFVQKRRFDTVVSFLMHANVIAAMASRFTQDTRYFQSIQTSQPNPRWHWKMQAFAQSAAEKIIVPSSSVARIAQEWSGAPEERLAVIPNALDPAEYREPMLTRLPKRDDTVRVGFVGRLDPVKRIPDLIEAIALLPQQFQLEVFGEGAERRRLTDLIRERGLEHRIHLRGKVTRPHTALAQIDMLVLPSIAEGFGIVLIEAMSAGVPIVATDVLGIRDVVDHERTALLVKVASPAELARSIERLHNDATLRNRIIANGYREVDANYTWTRVLPMYRALLGV